jgi:hypothetical protein
MANLRSVNTKFWEDPWVEDLNVTNKLLFLYLITNSYANLAGIYEITIKRICFETGIDKQSVSNGLKLFAKDKKAYFVDDNYIVLPNWLKNQNLNPNMKKGVVTIILGLPNSVKESVLGKGYQSIQKDYQSILNTLLKYEEEVLEEEEEEEEERKVEDVFSFEDFWIKYHSITNQSKTDKEPALKYWNKLSNSDKQKAIDNIQLYYDNIKDYGKGKMPKKARTYLSDKNFNDEYDLSHSLNPGNNVNSVRLPKPKVFEGYK